MQRHTMKPRLMVVAALTHLTLVCLFIWARLGAEGGGTLGAGLRSYRLVSGLFRDYSFFAPRVSSGVRVGFVVEEPAGPRFVPLAHENPEVARRFQCIASSTMNDVGVREVISRSWAAAVLTEYPQATKATVVAQMQTLPPPREFAAGARPTWDTIYLADFERKELHP